MTSEKVFNKEIDTKSFVSLLDKYKIKVSKTKKSSKDFLVGVGVISQNGNLKKPYKNLCIPMEQE